MSGVSDPVHSTETQNGTVDKEGKAGEDNLLLQKLLEQNRQVECTVHVCTQSLLWEMVLIGLHNCVAINY